MSGVRIAPDVRHPRTTIPLNGQWSIAPGDRASPPPTFEHSIPVPGVVDCAQPALTGEESDYFWYRRTIHTSGIGTGHLPILRIEQAQFGTAVWLDGRPVGESIACYTSQEYDLSGPLQHDGDHMLDVRVGRKETLPPNNAAGRDFEKSVYTPGIWGDVNIVISKTPRIEHVQVVPDILKGVAEVRITLDHCPVACPEVVLQVSVGGPSNGLHAGSTSASVSPGGRDVISTMLRVPVSACRLWSPEDPFLYQCTVRAIVDGVPSDEVGVRFGMREFAIDGNKFSLNGNPITLLGGNIAFHRFLADKERGLLPWDMEWVKKVFVEIPKQHHFNFFRFHLGHAYNRWYDMADEYGILLQDEWHFWGTTGANDAIREEFRQWVRDNVNHPSIIMWDALNESTDDSLVHDVIPEIKAIDPTRPWEAVDVKEHHPYIYSLGMTLNDRAFGFTDSLDSLESSSRPVIVNEYLWWWLDKDYRPTGLMKDVVERWVGRTPTRDAIIERQSYLARELTGLFRRMGCAAIQPFVYLSNNDGPTAHWFEGPISEAKPKPVLKALKEAFAPVGISFGMWDRHFVVGEAIAIPLHVFNDTRHRAAGIVRAEIMNAHGVRLAGNEKTVDVEPTTGGRITCSLKAPTTEGIYVLRCVVRTGGGGGGDCQRRIVVLDEANHSSVTSEPIVFDPGGEIPRYLHRRGIRFIPLQSGNRLEGRVLIAGPHAVADPEYQDRLTEISAFVDYGGTLIIQEPEFRVNDAMDVRVTTSLNLHIERRKDTDRGGYDSYVFPEDLADPLWKGIGNEGLQWFNGAYGGEIVSEYSVTPSDRCDVLASCGLGLHIPAVMRFRQGEGKVVISRLQIRGRLDAERQPASPFQRRYDPVASRYLHNLLSV